MARERIKGAVTASGSTESDKIIGNIDTIVGKISNAEELSVNNLENISKTLDAKLLDTIVSNSNSLKEYAVTQANMLMGITGYLLGNTGINKTSDFGSLKGSIKNTEPLFVSPTDTLNGLYDMLTELITNTGISGGGSAGVSSTLSVVLSSVDGGNLDSLIDLIKEVQKVGNTKSVEVLTAIEGVLKKLDKLGKMDVDTELIAMKMDDVQLAMFNIGETFNELSNLERRMSGIDIKAINTGVNTLSKFDFVGNFKNMQELIGFINNVAELKIPKSINKNISENTSRITEFIKVLVPFYAEMEKVPQVNYKRLIKNITNNVNRLPMLVDALNGIELKGFNKTKIKELQAFREVLYSFFYVLDDITYFEDIDVEDALDVLKDDILPHFEGKNGLVDRISGLDFKKFNKTTIKQIINFSFAISSFGDVLKTISKMTPTMIWLTMTEDIIFDGFELVYNMTYWLQQIVEQMKAVNKKAGVLVTFNGVMSTLVEIFKSLFKFGLLAVVFEKPLSMAINTLNKIITTINEKIQVPELNASIENLKPYATLMKDLLIVFGAVTIVGILAAPAIIGGLLLAAAVKVIFVVLSKAFESIKANVVDKKTHEALDSMTRLIIIMSGLMLVAALVGFVVIKFFANIMAFLGVFLIFLASITLVITLIGGLMQLMNAVDAVKTMATLGNFIQTLTIIMLVGALFMLTGLWKESLQFGAVLAGFIFIVLLPFVILGTFFKVAIKGAHEIATLIVTCTLVMMLGALFMLSGLHWQALGFGALLAAFIFLIMLPFVYLIKKGGRKALKAVDDIKQLVITCTIILVLGALLMMIPGFAENATLFALIIAGFVFLIVGTFALMGKKLQKAMGAMWGIMAIMVVSTFVLMLGANYVAQYGWEPMTVFGIILVGFIGVIGGACVILGKYNKDLMKGLLAMACIVGISMLFGITLKMVADAVNLADPLVMLEAVGVIAAIVLAIGGLSVALGALSAIPPTSLFFWAGIAACAAVAGIAVLLSVSIKNIAEAAKLMAEASNMGFEIDGALEIVGGMVAVGQAVGAAGLALPIGLIASTSSACTSMAIMISKIGKAVADISNLKVATSWDSDGNPISFRQLDKGDFEKAAVNTKEIIETLGKAIIKTYNDNSDLFVEPFAGFFGGKGKTPFDIVVRSCTGMGNMISSIANGVKDMADLKVATKWDRDGNAIEWRHLEKADFTNAAERVGDIVTTIGNKLAEVYSADTAGIYKAGLTFKDGQLTGGDIPAIRVLNAASLMGAAMSSIACGVKDMAELNIEIYDKDGKPTGTYRTLDKPDFKKAAENTSEVVSCLTIALNEVYAKHGHMFDEVVTYTTHSSGFMGMGRTTEKHVSDAPIVKVLSAAGNIGTFVSDCAAAVKAMADLSFIDSKGQKVNLSLTKDLGKTGTVAKNIEAVVTCVAQALINLYDKGKDTYFNPDYTGYDNIQNSFNKIKGLVDTAQKTIATIQETVDSIKNIPKLEKSWTNLLNALLNPVNDAASKINASQQATQVSNLRKQADNARSIITEINNLNEHKVDKFIELTDQLKDLSLNVEGMSGFIEALNGRINDTLNTVSERLLQSVTALEKSDKAQEKRNKMIKENTAELKKVLQTPLTITVKTEDDTDSYSDETSSSSSAAISGGTGEGSGDIGTPAANCGTGSISSDDFEKLAGTASEILGILKSHFGEL